MNAEINRCPFYLRGFKIAKAVEDIESGLVLYQHTPKGFANCMPCSCDQFKSLWNKRELLGWCYDPIEENEYGSFGRIDGINVHSLEEAYAVLEAQYISNGLSRQYAYYIPRSTRPQLKVENEDDILQKIIERSIKKIEGLGINSTLVIDGGEWAVKKAARLEGITYEF